MSSRNQSCFYEQASCLVHQNTEKCVSQEAKGPQMDLYDVNTDTHTHTHTVLTHRQAHPVSQIELKNLGREGLT